MMIPESDFTLRQMLAVYIQGEPEHLGVHTLGGRRAGGIYVETHGVSFSRGKPVLLAGKPLSLRAARSLAKALDEETRMAGHGMLPERILAAAPSGDLAWWAPAGRRHLRLAADIGLPSGTVHVPALLFALKGPKLFAFALKVGAKRPLAKAPLFQLPLWNCYHDGSMCMGSARFEREGTAARRIEEAEGAFWNSEFCAHLGGEARVKGGALKDLWEALIQAKGKFPLARLVPVGATLGGYLQREGF